MILIIPAWDRIKVNGRDLSDITAQEALSLLQTTDEKLTLEVLRKSPARVETSDTATQTESDWRKCPIREQEALSACEPFLASLYQGFLLPEEPSSDEEDYLPSMPHDVENAEELPCQALRRSLYPEQDLQSCYSDLTSPSLTENEENDGKTPRRSPDHHEWDSGLGCTDGSIQVDGNSEHDTETDDPSMQREGWSDTRDWERPAVSEMDSVEFSASDDQSDSGFCGISPEEYQRFQKILEGKCRQYQLRESHRQDLKNHQSLGHHGLEGPRKICEEGLQRSTWSPGLPTLQEYPEGTLTLPYSKHSEVTSNGGHRPYPAESMGNENEAKSQTLSSELTGLKASTIANPTTRCPSYLNLVREGQMAEWSEYSLDERSHLRLPNESRHDQSRHRGRAPCERSRVLGKKQQKSQLLKERAQRLREERSGTTTDDDAQSEAKLGRHWSKTERRQHLLLAKEQKQGKELLLQSRMDSLTESTSQGSRNDHNILELSHKKLMRKRSKKVLDNWITIQELLSHGAKTTVGGAAAYSPLLSVTTV